MILKDKAYRKMPNLTINLSSLKLHRQTLTHRLSIANGKLAKGVGEGGGRGEGGDLHS